MGRKCLGLLGMAMIFAASPVQAGDGLTNYGDIAQFAIPLIAASVSVAKSDKDGLLQLGATSVGTMATTYALKYSVNSQRPKGGGQSFPSGHTASAFMGASYLHYRYGWEYGLPAYAAAAVVGYSRVAADQHHWEDVVGAAVIANVSAFILTDRLDDRVQLVPFMDLSKRSFGIVGKIRF